MEVVFTAALLRLHSGFLEWGLDMEKVGRLPKNLERQKMLFNRMVFKKISLNKTISLNLLQC